jgi:AcrR family transcriptional regulator
LPQGAAGAAIVDAILAAARQILADEGYEKLTTNRLAQRAGVSIGSFYHYFSSKQAVVAALARELESVTLATFRSQLAVMITVSLEQAARGVIHFLATERLGQVAVRRELLRHVPRSWIESVSREVDAQVHSLLAAHLRERPDVRHGDEEQLAFIALHAVEAVVEASVLNRQDLIGSTSLLDELTRLVVRYLEADDRPA